MYSGGGQRDPRKVKNCEVFREKSLYTRSSPLIKNCFCNYWKTLRNEIAVIFLISCGTLLTILRIKGTNRKIGHQPYQHFGLFFILLCYIVILFWLRWDTIFGNKKRFLKLTFFTVYVRHFSHDHLFLKMFKVLDSLAQSGKLFHGFITLTKKEFFSHVSIELLYIQTKLFNFLKHNFSPQLIFSDKVNKFCNYKAFCLFFLSG